MKLGKLAMPSKKKAPEFDSELMFDKGGEESPDADAANELAGEAEGEDESAPQDVAEDSSELSSIPDEDLMAEIRKRGLLSKATSASKKPSADEEYL